MRKKKSKFQLSGDLLDSFLPVLCSNNTIKRECSTCVLFVDQTFVVLRDLDLSHVLYVEQICMLYSKKSCIISLDDAEYQLINKSCAHRCRYMYKHRFDHCFNSLRNEDM